MIQRGEGLGLAVKTCDAVPIPGDGLRQDLDGHVTIELGIGGTVDLAHAALTELARYFVVSNGLVELEPITKSDRQEMA